MSLAKNSVEGKSEAYVGRIENIFKELDSIRGSYMAECRELRSDIKEIYTEAKDQGVPIRPLKQLVKYRELERKQAALSDGLEPDDSAVYDTLIEALGDLGRAAAVKAGHAPKDDDADLRPTALKQAEKERADEEALAKLGKGKEVKAAAVDSLAP